MRELTVSETEQARETFGPMLGTAALRGIISGNICKRSILHFPRVVMAISIKALFFILIATSVTYAETNSFDTSTEYMVGDIVSVEGTLQAEVLTYTEDSIEIGLFNQEDQVTATLMWDVKTESGNVILNLYTEDEKTLPMSVTEEMNPENLVETLADGLLLMAAQTTEPLSPEELEFEADIIKDGRATRKASSTLSTSGSMVITPSLPKLQNNLTRWLSGRARYNRYDGDTNHVWVRFLAYNEVLEKFVVIGGVFANGPDNSYKFIVPESYDVDRKGYDLETAAFHVNFSLPGPTPPTLFYSRLFVADAWSAPGERTIFAAEELIVLLK